MRYAIDFRNTAAVLEEYARQVEALYGESISRNGRIATGSLLSSVHVDVKRGARVIAVDFNAAKYWEYVENDTEPHWPPVDAIRKWVEIKLALPSAYASGRPFPRDAAIRSTAFLVGRKIAREGTKGSHDLEETLRQVNAAYYQRLTDALVEDVDAATDAVLLPFIGTGDRPFKVTITV